MGGMWNDRKLSITEESVSKGSDEPVQIKLEEQDRRFAVDKTRKIEGWVLISGERVTISVENLHPGKVGYKLFFIGRKNGESVYKIMSDIVPDWQGNAEYHVNLNPADIDGEGTELSCFYIFMIAAMSKPIQPVLKGDMVKRQNEPKTYNGYYNQYIHMKVVELVAANSGAACISPFDSEWLASNWKRVTDISKFPVASVGAELLINKYGHFIFGAAGDLLFLGVPGRHNEEEWPDRGKSGFMLWQSIRGSDEYGYWCMVINCKNGIITEIP